MEYNKYIICCIISILFGAFHSAGYAQTKKNELFPQIRKWERNIYEKVYTPDNLWDLINGAADAYLQYGFKKLYRCEYISSHSLPVAVSVYHHNTRVNTFGIYSQERHTDYNFLDIGVQGYYTKNNLNFFTGKFYVKLKTQSKTDQKKPLIHLAQEINSHLRQDNSWPPLIGVFPDTNKVENSEQYINKSFLGYEFFQSVFVTQYTAGKRFKLFVMDLKNAPEADRVLETYLNRIDFSGNFNRNGYNSISDPYAGNVIMAVKDNHIYGLTGNVAISEARDYLNKIKETLKNID